MPNLTLLDIAKATGSDAEVGLIEEVTTHAPELQTLPARPIKGTSFKTTKRTNYPQGGFRGANQGVSTGKSSYKQTLSQCFFYDCQMQVDEAVVNADEGEIGDILANEASGSIAGTAINIGKQIYYGKDADEEGFSGLLANVDESNIEDNLGTGNSRTGVYFVYESIKGVHIVPGGDSAINIDDEWKTQHIQTQDGKAFTAYCNNASGYLGLAVGHKDSIVYVKNLTDAKPFTDEVAAKAIKKFPVHIVASGMVRCFMNRDAAFQLQKSRSSVGQTKADARGGSYAPLPTEVQGIPITITDSIETGGNEAK